MVMAEPTGALSLMTQVVAVYQQARQIPVEVTTFVGRRAERQRLRELMSRSRLVTLTGFGGIGKTRLALRVASDLRRTYQGGVVLAALGDLTDPTYVADEVAASLGLQGAQQSPTGAVTEFLRTRRVLLLMDNCEHVIEAAAVMADRILRSCPDVRILATSREPLRIDGETVFQVEQLTLPDTTPGGHHRLYDSEAVQLLVDRAQAVRPDFAVTADTREVIAAVCHKLGGIPLAIELAAARLRALSLLELDSHLTEQWDLLNRGSRTAPSRHGTMSSCIDWSFDLCSAEEQRLWARAAVFVDGFDLEAAEAVCSYPGAEPVADTLTSLVEKSVLTVVRDGTMSRYRMLPPIRQRGLAALDDLGGADEQRHRYMLFYTGLVSRAHAEWFSPRQLEWINRMRRESGNVHEALAICAEHPSNNTLGLQVAGNLLEFGLVEGLFRQGRRWLEALLESPSDNPGARALALRTASWWAANQSDLLSATRFVDEGMTIARTLDARTQAMLTQSAGFVHIFKGEVVEGLVALADSSRRFEDTGDVAELAMCYQLMGFGHALLDDVEGALDCHRRCVSISEAAGEAWSRSWSLWTAGVSLWKRGDVAAATETLKEGLRLKTQIDARLGIGVMLEALATVAVADDPERAAILLGAAQNEWDMVETTPASIPLVASGHGDTATAARTILGPAAYDRAWDQGRSLTETDAISLALEESRHVGPGGRPRPPATKQLLTRREQQVAEMIQRGLTNREIADSLVISQRTAEAHVEHILTKLGFTRRLQVAAWMGALVAEDHPPLAAEPSTRARPTDRRA